MLNSISDFFWGGGHRLAALMVAACTIGALGIAPSAMAEPATVSPTVAQQTQTTDDLQKANTEDELKTAVKKGGNIELTADITLSARLDINKKVAIKGQSHKLNGQLYFGGQAAGSEITGVNFVLDKDTKVSGWSSNVYIDTSNVTINDNVFSIAADATSLSHRAVGVLVYPSGNAEVAGTKITNNVFNQGAQQSATNFSVYIDNEINNAGKVTGTTISGNKLYGEQGETQNVSTDSFLGVFASPKTQGIEGLTLSGNDLGASTTNQVVLFQGGAKDITIENNTFGPTLGMNIYFARYNWGQGLPSAASNVTVKSNTFNGNTAVGSNTATAIDLGTLKYTTETNNFGSNTSPYYQTGKYAAMFYVGEKLLEWQITDTGKAPTKPNGNTTKWYTDSAFTKEYNFTTDESNNDLLKLYAPETPTTVTWTFYLDPEADPTKTATRDQTVGASTAHWPNTGYKKDGYTFKGYRLKYGSNKTVFRTPADYLKTVSGKVPSTPVKFNAVWEKNPEPTPTTVTWTYYPDPVDHADQKTTHEYTIGASFPKAWASHYEKSGYTFKGYQVTTGDKPGADDAVYRTPADLSKKLAVLSNGKITKDMTFSLYAVWEKNDEPVPAETFTIRFVRNDGSHVQNSYTYDEGVALNGQSQTRNNPYDAETKELIVPEGQHFAYWYYTDVTADWTLYAKFEADKPAPAKVTVTFKGYLGLRYAVTIDEGAPFSVAKAQLPWWMMCSHWFYGNGQPVGINDHVTKDLTVYAHVFGWWPWRSSR